MGWGTKEIWLRLQFELITQLNSLLLTAMVITHYTYEDVQKQINYCLQRRQL